MIELNKIKYTTNGFTSIKQTKKYTQNHLSKTSKMECFSWSLPVSKITCPGSLNKDGTVALACQGCYGKSGHYHMPNVKKVREDNLLAWRQDDWESLMIDKLKDQPYFRWLDSGDLYNIKLAQKVYNIMLNTPYTRHWLPTRMYKFHKFLPILNKMNELDNVCVRFSSDAIDGSYISNLHGSTILPTEITSDPDIHICQAYNNDGKCSGCKSCWNKNIKVIGYLPHGQKMLKLIKEINS